MAVTARHLIDESMAASRDRLMDAEARLRSESLLHGQHDQSWATVNELRQQLEVTMTELNDVKTQLQGRKQMKTNSTSDEMIVGKWSELHSIINTFAYRLSGFKLRLWPPHIFWRLQLLSPKVPEKQSGLFSKSVAFYLKAYLWHVVFTGVFHSISGAWRTEPRSTLSTLKLKIISKSH